MFRPLCSRALCALLLVSLVAELATAAVYLNKYRRDKLASEDVFELTNSGLEFVDVAGWEIRTLSGEYVIPSPAFIFPQGRLIVRTPIMVNRIGESIELIDDAVLLGGPLADRVRFGTVGGAPAPPLQTDAALVRVPDGIFNPPSAPANDELFWTIDLTPNFGAVNNVPPPQLGSSLRINELRVGSLPAPDFLELFNPSPFPINVLGWFVTSAESVEPLNGFAPPFGFVVFQLPSTQLAITQRLDLFNADSVRVDQKGFAPLALSDCYGDCPDGAAPPNGHDFATCGGWFTWFPVNCTLGQPNSTLPGQGCSTSGVETPTHPPADEVVPVGWGRLKQIYR